MVSSASADKVMSPGHQPAQERVIDLVHLAKQTLGDRGLELEVLRIYDQVARGYFTGLKEASSPDVLKLNLHSLKGASAGIGANGVATLARAAENELMETGKIESETVADIGMALEEVSTYISELLKS